MLPWLRILTAFVVAPVAPALAFAPVAILAGGAPAGLGLAAYALILNAAVAYPIALFAGAPAYRFFQMRGWVGAGAYAAGGLAVGAATGALAGGLSLEGVGGAVSTDAAGAAMMVAGATLCGALVGVTFWLIARPGGG